MWTEVVPHSCLPVGRRCKPISPAASSTLDREMDSGWEKLVVIYCEYTYINQQQKPEPVNLKEREHRPLLTIDLCKVLLEV
jgi:hypothetical protein